MLTIELRPIPGVLCTSYVIYASRSQSSEQNMRQLPNVVGRTSITGGQASTTRAINHQKTAAHLAPNDVSRFFLERTKKKCPFWTPPTAQKPLRQTSEAWSHGIHRWTGLKHWSRSQLLSQRWAASAIAGSGSWARFSQARKNVQLSCPITFGAPTAHWAVDRPPRMLTENHHQTEMVLHRSSTQILMIAL